MPLPFIDGLVDYVRTRQRMKEELFGRTVDEERLMRTALRHIRRNPIPTALLGERFDSNQSEEGEEDYR